VMLHGSWEDDVFYDQSQSLTHIEKTKSSKIQIYSTRSVCFCVGTLLLSF